MEYVYAANFEQDDGGYLVTFPDVPEAITQGDDYHDARASAVDALSTALRGYLDDGKDIPAPEATGEGLVMIAVDPETALKIAVIVEVKQQGISKSELARRLGKHENEARRILDPNHATKLSAMSDALAVLGKEIVITLRDAA